MTYNPADYSAVLNEAKAMSKTELEKIYTEDRSKKHLNCIETIGMIIMVLLSIFAVGFIGYIYGEESMKENLSSMRKDLSNTIEIVTEDICQILGEDYKSPKFFDSSYLTNQIICNDCN